MKKIIAIVLASAIAMGLLAGCAGAPAASEQPAETKAMAAAEEAAPAAEEAKPAEEAKEEAPAADAASGDKKDILFYGKIVEYSSGEPTCAKLEELLADKYNIESLQVDWGNLEQVIRTGIASDEPCDVYNYWPQYINTFVKSNMCLDLTPYLDANGGEWRNTFNADLLTLGEIDGKVYGVPTTPNFSCMVANKALFEAAGIELPEGTMWSWDDFTAACAKLKESGVFPIAAATDNQKGNWIWGNGLLGYAKEADKVDEFANGEIPCTDEMFTKAFTNTKALYDNQYMYPGEGAVTLTTDEARAAFAQGKTALCCETAAGICDVLNSLDFEAVIVPWPSMASVPAVTGGADGLFIPANVKDPDAAVEVLKTYMSPEVQQINADNGFSCAVNGINYDNPIVEELSKLSSATVAKDFKSFDATIEDYYVNQALPELVLGGGVEATQQALEELRQNAAQ